MNSQSTLTVTKLPIPSAKMNGVSSLPPVGGFQPGKRSGDFGTDEYAGLFIDYGLVAGAFPYREQDLYTRELYDNNEDVVILENEYLRATFFPHYGGKLAALYDKAAGKDLLFFNPVIRPCNLATRNAWMSGGIEWNCGIFGHHVHTCDTLFTTTLKMEDGTPVLRFYEYERIRRAVVQMDFFLPAGSKMLYARMRVTNTTREVIPMYWWSNAGVVEDPEARVVTWANGAYVADNNVSEAPIPIHNGIDVSYPSNIPTAVDYFYNIPDRKRKFEAMMDKNGYGYVQTSTSRLQGRKLFVWGTGTGGERWKNYLTRDDLDGAYVELQSGLAHSQYESLPMPPSTTWEWIEGYGAIHADAAKVHGDWLGAQKETARALDELITEDALEDMLIATRKMATTPADGGILFAGSGWGALENMRREKAGERQIAPHLDFGEVGPEQDAWVSLLRFDHMTEPDPDVVPPSYMLQEEWTKMLERACDSADRFNWYAHYQLGMIRAACGDIEGMKDEVEKSMALCKSPWGYYAMAKYELDREDRHANEGAVLALKASQMKPDDVSLAKIAVTFLVQLGMHQMALDHISTLPPEIKSNSRIQLYELMAHIRMKNIDEADAIFKQEGGLVVADVREGEGTVTELWLELEELKAKRDGREFDRNTAEVPELYEFRPWVPKKKK